MNLYSKRKRFFFIPWAIAVCLICTGSLINFHQHRIWGWPLLPQLVAIKKDVEKTQTDIVLAKIRSDKEHPVLHFNLSPSIITVKYLHFPLLSLFFSRNEFNDRSPSELSIHTQGRRAPPLA